MILDLKDKLDGFGTAAYETGLFAPPSEEVGSGSSWDEAREGLKADIRIVNWTKYGSSSKKDVTTADSVDVLMKRALQMLFTG